MLQHFVVGVVRKQAAVSKFSEIVSLNKTYSDHRMLYMHLPIHNAPAQAHNPELIEFVSPMYEECVIAPGDIWLTDDEDVRHAAAMPKVVLPEDCWACGM